jgi:fengycin family lipopeptide synthetase D
MSSTNAIQDVYPLSPLQEGLLFKSLSNPSSSYHVQTIYRLDGRLLPHLVEKSLQRLFERHDMLRTSFVSEGLQRMMQVVLRERRADFRSFDVAEHSIDRQLEEFLADDRKRSFDLRNDVLMRVALFSVENSSVLVWSYHHILMDGGCTATLVAEFNRIYAALASAGEAMLPPVAPYKNYIRWLERQDRKAASAFWKSYLEGFEGNPVWFHPVAGADAQGMPQDVAIQLTGEETRTLQAAARKQHVTFNNYLQLAWGLLLSLYGNRRDVVFGTVCAVRPAEVEGIDRMIGLFINTVPWRLHYGMDDSFSELVAAQDRQRTESLLHQHCPLADIQSASPLGNRLFDHIFVISSELGSGLEANEAGSDVAVAGVQNVEEVDYGFSVHVSTGETLRICFTYRPGMVDRSLVASMAQHYKRLLRIVSSNPQISLREIQLLDEVESAELLKAGEGTQRDYEGSMIDRFRNIAGQHANHVAITAADGTLTYEELDNRSTVLALELENEGMKRGDVVAVLSQRHAAWIVSILAIWKAGGAYLPLDPAHPDERLLHQVGTAACRLLLTDAANSQRLATASARRCSLQPSLTPHVFPAGTTYRGCQPEQCAYIIFTSGTTGKPKGVPVSQASLVETIEWHNEFFSMKSGETVLQFASCGFDASLVEIFMALLSGGRVAVLPEEDKSNTARFTQFLQHHQPGLAILPPAYIRMLQTKELAGLKKLISTGEAAVWERMLELSSDLFVCNGYGPTEACVGACFHKVLPELAKQYHADRALPIGRPFANKRIALLDEAGRLLPKGVSGEICIGGDGITTGYLNEPARTAGKFLSDVFFPGDRWYRTGDRGRWNAEGELLFEGRFDNQVQIHGIRVELGEIESVLLRFPNIRQALVRLAGNSHDPFICAYLESDEEYDEQELSRHLHRFLPAHMVPGWCRRLSAFPLTPNGKIDIAALPQPDDAHLLYREPQTPTEIRVCQLFSKVLERERFGARDHFFLSGGHSIRGIRLLTLIEKEFDLNLPLRQLFEHPTPELLSRYIDAVLWTRVPQLAEAAGAETDSAVI